jgi:hypothetical protein
VNISFATAAKSPEAVNEDFVLATPDVVVLLDGAGLPPEADTGCGHGLPWFVRTLAHAFVDLAGDNRTSLREALRASIVTTAQAHQDTCDPMHPFSPSATVVAVRGNGDLIDWLVLSDSTLLLASQSEVSAYSDQRVKQVATTQRSALRRAAVGNRALWTELAEEERRLRNQVDGYWVAAGDPKAADYVIDGTVARRNLVGAVLLSDGAARPVEPFAVASWDDCFDWISSKGPASWISRVHEIDDSDPERTRWPRSKVHDDATAVWVQW